jgi:hypothetical protein
MAETTHKHDTRTEGGVKVKKRKKRQKKLFKLSAMNQLVDENSFLKNKYDNLAQDGEDKLGYHWNEAVQTILFNKYVKPSETLMGRYLQIKRIIDVDSDQDVSKPKNPAAKAPEAPAEETPTPDPTAPEVDPETLLDPVAAPAAPLPAGNDPVDTRITTESTDTMSTGNYQTSGPLVTTKGGMNSFMSKWKAKIKKDQSGMTMIEPNREQHTMGQNAFKTLNESGLNPLANPALLTMLLEEFAPEQEATGTDETTDGDTSTDCRSETGVTVGLIDSLISISRVLATRGMEDKEVIEALKDLKGDEDINFVLSALDKIKDKPTQGEAGADEADAPKPATPKAPSAPKEASSSNAVAERGQNPGCS